MNYRRYLIPLFLVIYISAASGYEQLVYVDAIKDLLNNNYLVVEQDNQEHAITTYDIVIDTLQTLPEEKLETLRPFIQQLQAHELDIPFDYTQDERFSEPSTRKKLKDKTYCALVVSQKLLTNNLTVCNNAKFNNVIITGTLKACSTNICSIITTFSSPLLSGTSADIPLTLVLRDSTGSFAATTITLTGCLVLTDALNNVAGTICANTHALIVAPQGSRALQATAQGNVRGTNAIDLQINNNGSSQVASGNYSGILSGTSNTASGNYSIVTGGADNTASGIGSVVAGGGIDGIIFSGNTVSGAASCIGGGMKNSTTTKYSGILTGSSNKAATLAAVAGGVNNNASASGSYIGGGGYDGTTVSGNITSGNASVVLGGIGNQPEAGYGGVLCGMNNSSSPSSTFFSSGGGLKSTFNTGSPGSTIIGGGYDGVNTGVNKTAGMASFAGGGLSNSLSGYSGILSGSGNTTLNSNTLIVVVGGQNNGPTATHTNFVIMGGSSNAPTNNYSAILAGKGNTANSGSAVAGGGYDGTNTASNTASGAASFIGNGLNNTAAASLSAVLSGSTNTINSASTNAVILGGITNSTTSANALLIGSHIANTQPGSFIWSDISTPNVNSSGSNAFVARASGGTYIYTSTLADFPPGVKLAPGGGSWLTLSDINTKSNILSTNSMWVLDTLSTLTTYTWSFITQGSSSVHIGLMAQDVHDAFLNNENPNYINDSDAIGVLMTSVQALYQLYTQSKYVQKRFIEREIYIANLKRRLERIENIVNNT